MTDIEHIEQTTPDAPDGPQEFVEVPRYSTAARTKYVLFGLVLVLAFLVAYGTAAARNGSSARALAGTGTGAGAGAGAGAACTGCTTEAEAEPAQAAGTAACTGCDSSAPAVEPQAAATLAGGVQKISVDVSAGYFDPTIIDLAAGVPTEITFGEGSGCLAEVEFPDFDISQDLTKGGAVVKLPALQPGEYGFNCGMQMVFGTLVVH